MKTYKIIARTNGYIASRDALFGGETEITIEGGISLREARGKLLELYNQKFGNKRPYACNWGMAVIQSKPYCDGAAKTFHDGTRSFDWDSRTYTIELEKNEE